MTVEMQNEERYWPVMGLFAEVFDKTNGKNIFNFVKSDQPWIYLNIPKFFHLGLLNLNNTTLLQRVENNDVNTE